MAQVGRLVAGQYRLIEKIGRGGFGVVWRAQDERLDREVAVKELYLPSYLGEGQRKERRTRSLREARSAARIDHRGAVTVYDVVEEDDCPFIVMEYLKGRSLEDIVKEDGPLPVPQVAEIGLQLLETLRAAHSAGVVHRDVKPSNVIITEKRAVLTDFGIATIEGDISITQSGFVMGAPAYCSPERAKGDRAGTASDLWSLGATLYYAVEGHQPFPGTNANQVFHAILTAPHRPTHRAGMLGPLLDGLLIKDISERLTASDTALLLAGATQPGAPREHVTLPSKPPKAAKIRRVRRSRFFVPVLALLVFTSGTLAWAARDDPPARIPARAQNQAKAEATALETGATNIRSMTVSGDGTTLAVGTEDKAVQLWDVATGKKTATLGGPENAVFVLAYSADGRYLAGGGYDGVVYVWRTADHELVSELLFTNETVNTLGFSRDGTRLTVATTAQISDWSVATGKRKRMVAEEKDSPFSVAVSPKGTMAYASSRGVWLRGKRLGPLPEVQPIMSLTPDGRLLAVASAGEVTLWNGDKKKRTVAGSGQMIKAVAFTSDGALLACADGRTVTVWETSGWKVRAPVVTASANVNAVAFAGGVLAVATEDGRIELTRVG